MVIHQALQAWKTPQAAFLGLGILLAYVFLILWQGNRPIVWGLGGLASLTAIVAWTLSDQQPAKTVMASLLDPPYFAEQLSALEALLADPRHPLWQTAKAAALESQTMAVHILERESLLLSELLETLHTVQDLAKQIVDGLTILGTMKTAAYRQLAEEKLRISADRLQQTRSQLQELQDQVTLASLEQQLAVSAPLPERLKLLIVENKNSLQGFE